MAQQDLSELGFRENGSQSKVPPAAEPQQSESNWQERKQKGFVAGVRRSTHAN